MSKAASVQVGALLSLLIKLAHIGLIVGVLTGVMVLVWRVLLRSLSRHLVELGDWRLGHGIELVGLLGSLEISHRVWEVARGVAIVVAHKLLSVIEIVSGRARLSTETAALTAFLLTATQVFAVKAALLIAGSLRSTHRRRLARTRRQASLGLCELLVRDWLGKFPQLCVTMGKVALFCHLAISIVVKVPAPLGLVLVVDLGAALTAVALALLVLARAVLDLRRLVASLHLTGRAHGLEIVLVTGLILVRTDLVLRLQTGIRGWLLVT